jgi:hypothetical protein
MKDQIRMTTASAVAAAALIPAMAIDAHHSPAMFDTETAVTISGTVVRLERGNPHSYMYLEQETPEGVIEWAVEGPAPNALLRRGTAPDAVAPGDTVEACGYRLKETAQASRNGRPQLLVAEVVLMPDGVARLWSDYGNTRCRDQNRYTVRAQ